MIELRSDRAHGAYDLVAIDVDGTNNLGDFIGQTNRLSDDGSSETYTLIKK